MKRFVTLLCLSLLMSGCASHTQEPIQSAAVTGDESASGALASQEDGAADERETAPTAAEPMTPDNLTDLLETTNTRRQNIVKPEPDTGIVAEWKIDDLEPNFDMSETVLDFQPTFSESDVYTLEQAQADVDYLFFFYELGYGPYFHFGGKEAFDNAKEAILTDIEAMDSITAPAFEATLIEHLAFVKDAHFVINQNYNHPKLQGYLSEQTFLQDSAGFMASESGSYVQSIDGRVDFADKMVLALTPEGTISYRYCVMAQNQPEPVEMVYTDGTTRKTPLFSSHEAAGQPEEREEIVSLTRTDDIPVITVTSMGFPHAGDDRGANRFLELAEELQEEPVLIVDLRNNGGGNGILPQMWYEAYTGTYITPNHYNLFRLDLYNAFNIKQSEPNPDSFYYIPADIADYYTKPQTINDSWNLENAEPRQVVDNDRLLIILTSKRTASAADNFTDLAFNVENTLVIGSNTTGMFVSAAAIGVKMPNSGMVGQMGFNLSVFDDAHFQEGVGFMPDLWTSGDALEAALALGKQRLAQK